MVEYRDIAGFTAYRVGDDGSVWTRRVPRSQRSRLGEWRLMSPGVKDRGHLYVNLHEGGKVTRRHVHHLVLEAFTGPCPEGLECRHLDGDPSNNRHGNLVWGTRGDNVGDAMLHGTTPKGDHHYKSKLKQSDLATIRELRGQANPPTFSEIGLLLGVCEATVRAAYRGRNWAGA